MIVLNYIMSEWNGKEDDWINVTLSNYKWYIILNYELKVIN